MTEKTSTRRRGRKLASLLAGGLALSLLPFAAPAGAQTTPRSITEACPPDEIPSDVFEDVDPNSTHADAIDCVFAYEITEGTEDGGYEPGGTVPREQMATFIARLIDYVSTNGNGTPLEGFDTDTDTNAFPCDVAVGSGNALNPHYVNINRLAASTYTVGEGADAVEQAIVEGTGDDADGDACFDPGAPVSREQMASFINRAELYLGVEILTDDDFFDDDGTSVHEDNINAIAEERIAVGTSSRIYNPGGNVQRDQMASFLARKLDVLFADVNTPTDVTFTTPPPNAIVTLSDTTPDEGDTVAGVVDTASNILIEEIEVSGSCTDTLTTANDTANPLNFNVDIDGDSVPDGDGTATCVLMFVTTFADNPADTDTITITVTEVVEPPA